MDDHPRYTPNSDFLWLFMDGEVPLSGSVFGDANLALLIRMTQDPDDTNRDWATFHLSQSECDSAAIQAAFERNLDDPYKDVRLEALVGLAKRNPAAVRDRIVAMLQDEWIDSMTLEAASFIADPALLPLLEAIKDQLPDWDDGLFGMEMEAAVEHCTSGVPPEWRDFSD